MPRRKIAPLQEAGEIEVVDYPIHDDVQLTISEVFDVAELADLAHAWAREGAGMSPERIDRYHVLAKMFSVEPALLLYVCQRKLAELPDGLPTSEDGVSDNS